MKKNDRISYRISVENQSGFRINKTLLVKAVKLICREIGLKKVDLGFLCVTDMVMRQYHQQFFKKRNSTDVISFPLMETPDRDLHECVGDILICPEAALLCHARYEHTLAEEFLTYVVHGILHILGYDDLKLHAKKIMFRKQDQLLALLRKNGDFFAVITPANPR